METIPKIPKIHPATAQTEHEAEKASTENIVHLLFVVFRSEIEPLESTIPVKSWG